jgi:hypothetical protein
MCLRRTTQHENSELFVGLISRVQTRYFHGSYLVPIPEIEPKVFLTSSTGGLG